MQLKEHPFAQLSSLVTNFALLLQSRETLPSLERFNGTISRWCCAKATGTFPRPRVDWGCTAGRCGGDCASILRSLRRMTMSARDKRLRFRTAPLDTAPDFVVTAALAGVRAALRQLANDPRLLHDRFGEADGHGPGLSRRRDRGVKASNPH